jgi:hypothetical protein
MPDVCLCNCNCKIFAANEGKLVYECTCHQYFFEFFHLSVLSEKNEKNEKVQCQKERVYALGCSLVAMWPEKIWAQLSPITKVWYEESRNLSFHHKRYDITNPEIYHFNLYLYHLTFSLTSSYIFFHRVIGVVTVTIQIFPQSSNSNVLKQVLYCIRDVCNII